MSGLSVATIRDPEFVNVTSISPLVSKCNVKVLYLGENRNRSFITKDVALNMAETLRGCPIVGQYIENKEDFGDHGQQLIIDGEGVHFKCLTKPFGFVAPDSKIWFQEYNDTDEFGNSILREYLMTEGYLWTGQFPECQSVIQNGKPQSMELDEATLKGHWSENTKSGIEFFIIDDATFSKLCILGDDVEPCFEGANVTSAETKYTYSLDTDFKHSLYSMMEQLKYTLNENIEGGKPMEEILETPVEEAVVEEVAEVVEEETVEVAEPAAEENFSENQDNVIKTDTPEIENITEDEKDLEEAPVVAEEDTVVVAEEEAPVAVTEEAAPAQDYALLEENFKNLQAEYDSLKTEYEALVQFKLDIEDKEKQDLIQKEFYMLSDDDKKEIFENRANYSLNEIKSQLALVCFEKKVSFALAEEETESKDEETVATTFDMDSLNVQTDAIAAALKQIRENQN